MFFDLVRHDLKIVGVRAVVMPIAILALFAGVAALMGAAGSSNVARLMVAAIEFGLPAAAGIVAANVPAADPAVELQLALPRRYASEVLLRLGLVTVWTAMLAFAATAVLRLADLWWIGESFPTAQLAWLAPLAWLTTIGALLALVLRSGAGAAGIVGGLAVLELMLAGILLVSDWTRPWFLFTTLFAPASPFWLANRATLLVTAVAFGLAAWTLLHRNELLMWGDQ